MEDEEIILLIFRILVLICPVVCLVGLLWHLWRHRKWTLKGIMGKGMDRIREKREVRREEKLHMKEEEKQFEEDADEDLELHAVTDQDLFQK